MKTIRVNPTLSIQSILDQHEEGELTIVFEKGIYREKLRIQHSHVTLKGEESMQTILVWNDAANHNHPDGKLMNTFRTPTLTVLGDDVHLEHLIIVNDAGLGKEVGQAVACSVYGDHFVANHCCFQARQDTLFLGPLPDDLTIRYQGFLPQEELHTRPLRQTFIECKIQGDVDFIFGGGQAWFDHCQIEILTQGYLAAPSTSQFTEFGFVFHHCTIRSIDNQAKPFLARPWREYGSCVFLDCEIHGPIHEERYHDWEKRHYRFLEFPYVSSKHSHSLTNQQIKAIEAQMINIRNRILH